ncbi:MAG TPA: Lrp/AsnC family transcriptional regulator [Dehalococcoidia bacterium]|nr:Lrp/AsnC family transcriptional regulator [Dehalococcoidia bacterium]
MTASSPPIDLADPVNAAILAVSEDRLSGFREDPFADIAAQSGVDLDTVIERVRAMLEAGTIRRVRQTVQATKLAAGALVAWRVDASKLDAAFEYMVHDDPFSGHVVLRSTDAGAAGHDYRLWTTLKVPQGFSLQRHCDYLMQRVGAEAFLAMPARCLFVLGVGHIRRRTIDPGSKSDGAADVMTTDVVTLTPRQWAVLSALKRELEPDEIVRDVWTVRAGEAGLDLEDFVAEARSLEAHGLMGRFSTFLEHVKPLSSGELVTRYNALFHWSVPAGRELEAGREIGRHHILTHAYWREGGPAFGNVNVMAVAHGLDKQLLLEHKRAIDAHLASIDMPVSYTNVFWGGRSEIKPSEVMPEAYEAWCASIGIDPETMREQA